MFRKRLPKPIVTCLCLSLIGASAVAGQVMWRTTGSLNQARLQTPATLLPDGRVLLVGSLSCNPGCTSYATGEVYDPAKGLWSPILPPHTPRFNHAIVLLQSGRVLVAGGYLTPGVLTGSCEIFDPATEAWTQTGSLSTPRQFHEAVMLADGRVLVAGGLGMDGKGSFVTLGSAEIYDPASGQWSSAGTLAAARYLNTLTILGDGRVLAVGGEDRINGQSDSVLSSAELYDPESNSWNPAASLLTARSSHSATVLPSGLVLISGGYAPSGLPIQSAELYDPGADHWTPAAGMRAPRGDHSATLVAGGCWLWAGEATGLRLKSMIRLAEPGPPRPN